LLDRFFHVVVLFTVCLFLLSGVGYVMYQEQDVQLPDAFRASDMPARVLEHYQAGQYVRVLHRGVERKIFVRTDTPLAHSVEFRSRDAVVFLHGYESVVRVQYQTSVLL
jgi:hypothetical protein